jgi:hypothetical protein
LRVAVQFDLPIATIIYGKMKGGIRQIEKKVLGRAQI